MPRINLLPWREEERKKRQQDFMVALAAAVLAAIAVVGLTFVAFNQMIDNQQARNQRLETEIAGNSIARMRELDQVRKQLERDRGFHFTGVVVRIFEDVVIPV